MIHMKKFLIATGLLGSSLVVPGLVMKSDLSSAKSSIASVELAKLFADEGVPGGMPSGSKPKDQCHDAFDAAIAAQPKREDYQNAVLGHLHMELFRANKLEAADVEMIFCRLSKIMGVDPDLSALPQTVTKSDPRGNTITATIEVPTESWATAAGYQAKATIKNNDTQFMALWWAGKGDSSKGYVIQGSNPMQLDSTKRLRYAMWDRTTENQSIKVYAAQFGTSFLTTPAAASDARSGGDNAHFGHVTFNTSSKAITAQSIEIRAGRDSSTSSGFKCVRTYFTGTLGGTVTGYRPAKGIEEVTSETSTGGVSSLTADSSCAETNPSKTSAHCGLDGSKDIVDAKTTSDAVSPVGGSQLPSGTFDWSCNDVNGAGATGKPFTGNAVSFTTSPSAVFPK
jgi:hypothetical protein